MSTAIESQMTVEEFLALPDDGTDRELIRGELREQPKTVRNRFHSESMCSVGWLLANWAIGQQVRPRIVSGEAGFILRTEPHTVVGIDVAVVSAETMARQTDETALIDGVPLLAVEILSPSDTMEAIHEKEQLYLECGVPLIWVVDPFDRTVKVREQGEPPRLFNEQQVLTADPHLPGFQVAVKDLFGPQ